MAEQTPVDTLEPLVLFHLTSTRTRSQPFMFVLDEQLLDRRFAQTRRRCAIREQHFVLENIRKRRISVRSFERGRGELGSALAHKYTHNHLVN